MNFVYWWSWGLSEKQQEKEMKKSLSGRHPQAHQLQKVDPFWQRGSHSSGINALGTVLPLTSVRNDSETSHLLLPLPGRLFLVFTALLIPAYTSSHELISLLYRSIPGLSSLNYALSFGQIYSPEPSFELQTLISNHVLDISYWCSVITLNFKNYKLNSSFIPLIPVCPLVLPISISTTMLWLVTQTPNHRVICLGWVS